jgi:hypothetical protein
MTQTISSKAERFRERISSDNLLAEKASNLLSDYYEKEVMKHHSQHYPDPKCISNLLSDMKKLGLLTQDVIGKYADNPNIKLELHKNDICYFWETGTKGTNNYYVEDFSQVDNVYEVVFCLKGTEDSDMVNWLEGQICYDWLRNFYIEELFKNDLGEVIGEPFEDIGLRDRMMVIRKYLDAGRMIAF